MIYVGIDDTDILGAPGTNQLAKFLAAELADQYFCKLIVRHQLLDHPKIPYTSKNSAAAILLMPGNGVVLAPLIEQLRSLILGRFVDGSDPGLCVTEDVPDAVLMFGRRCQREVVAQTDARKLAAEYDLHLEGLGGTEDGVIGALAAVGLAAIGDDGRIVQIGEWPDDLADRQEIATLHDRGVEVRCQRTGDPIACGVIDIGKHLRPNYRQKDIVLLAKWIELPGDLPGHWQAVRRT